MASYLIPFCNRRGIPCLEAKALNLTADNLVVTFANHPKVGDFFQGLIAIKITQTFTAPTTAVPVVFATEGLPGSQKPLVTYGDAEVNTGMFPTPGIFLVFYDRASDKLQLISYI